MQGVRFTGPAQSDLASLLAYPQDQFGKGAAERYEALIAQAVLDLAEKPERRGSVARPEFGKSVRTYHLRYSRRMRGNVLVQRPRHLLLYQATGSGTVMILRVLHDAMEISRHLSPDRP